MTYNELMEIIDENDGEVNFANGNCLTDWSGGRFCTYTEDQHFGQGEVVDLYDAIRFYEDNI
jgi:hypothetical protein